MRAHETFRLAGGRRQVLVVDDELVNRELMGHILEPHYEVLFAEDGQRAMEVITERADTLSLVLLDLMMPIMSGQQVLATVADDPALHAIPVIVLTADQAAEVESLDLGAADFIPKPYPSPGVILARINRTIELFEDRQTIQSTERDPLTGLYTREYFLRYAEQYDQYHRDAVMDAVVVDINHFHTINDRYGTAYGDKVLRCVGSRVRSVVAAAGGIVCRRSSDTFLAYCPHGTDYQAVLESAGMELAGNDDTGNSRVRLRMGVYPNVDKSLGMDRRFDRAKMAADTVRDSFANAIGLYDHTLHEQELYEERLIEDFPKALAERQFEVFYQPKFTLQGTAGVLAGAEALIRWRHPELGMINPGVFISLFERNGLIQKLDTYMWRTTARQIRKWKDRFAAVVPVSVNVSRIDLYDPAVVDTLCAIVSEAGLATADLALEITESAYTRDPEQIIAAARSLRDVGFHIDMDDFGSGYSALNMVSTLPLDGLKLDMQFIRMAFERRRDVRLIEIVVEIARHLDVPVTAEGVETAEQVATLRATGCDIAQGFHFSRPVPADEFEPFLEAWANARKTAERTKGL